MGFVENWKAVMGSNPWYWLVPTDVDDDALDLTRAGLCYCPDDHKELLTVLERSGTRRSP